MSPPSCAILVSPFFCRNDNYTRSAMRKTHYPVLRTLLNHLILPFLRNHSGFSSYSPCSPAATILTFPLGYLTSPTCMDHNLPCVFFPATVFKISIPHMMATEPSSFLRLDLNHITPSIAISVVVGTSTISSFTQGSIVFKP